MAKGKKGFLLYANQYAMVEKLTDEQAGKLLKQIYMYVNDLDPSEPKDVVVSIVWTSIMQSLKQDLKLYEEKCEKNKNNIQKYWDTKRNQTNTNDIQTNSDIDKEKDIDSDKDITNKENDISQKKTITSQRFVKPTVEEIKEYCKANAIQLDAQYFFDFYESKGWVIGKSPMKNWKKAIATWTKNQKTSSPQNEDNSLGNII